MNHLAHQDALQIVEGQLNYTFVVISIVLACVSTMTALALLVRLNNKSFINKGLWIIAASIAVSFGIWSMHYMGMLAYAVKIQLTLDLALTIISMIPIVVMSLLAFYVLTLERLTRVGVLTSSLLFAIGVGAMHLVGMHSIDGNIHHTYKAWAIVLGVALPFLAFFVLGMYYRLLGPFHMQVVFGLMIGLAVSMAHYILMFGMTMYAEQSLIVYDTFVQYEYASILASVLIFSVGLIVALLIIWIIMDYFLTKRVERFDTVTHLANAQQLFEDLEKNRFKRIALWIFNDFEYMNKTYGYIYGDEYIKQLAHRVKQYMSEDILIYRTGENQLLIASTASNEKFVTLQQQLVEILAKPLHIVAGVAPIEPKAVCALSDGIEITAHEHLKQVTSISRMPQLQYDFSIITYNAAIHSFGIQDEVILGIDEAMLNNELFLVYQPKHYAKTRELAGAEVLLRWHSKEYGFISPGVFVPLLEQIGKMDVVTDWVIEKVCQQIVDWKRRGINVGPIAINIPGEYLITDALKSCLLKMMDTYDVTPADIELELTETSFVQNLEQAMRAVQYYKDLGFGVALDDFGTGLSSMSYLRQMQISTLKVDKSFIDHVPCYQKDVAIAKTIIALGEALQLKVVVEGIETEQQLNFVLEVSENPIVQGYYFSKPLFVYDLEQYLENHRTTLISN